VPAGPKAAMLTPDRPLGAQSAAALPPATMGIFTSHSRHENRAVALFIHRASNLFFPLFTAGRRASQTLSNPSLLRCASGCWGPDKGLAGASKTNPRSVILRKVALLSVHEWLGHSF
jgi:hypothetical protein